MKKSMRLFAVLASAAICGSAVALFAGCDTNYPEVAITYEFNGTEYEVEYTLSRKGAPQTVQHFIELADAGYYDGTVIHDYRSNGIFLYGGAYRYNADGELEEKDYWTELRNYEKEHGPTFTQTVFARGSVMANYLTERGDYIAAGEVYNAESEKVPLYTLHGEFSGNGVTLNGKSYRHQKGALGMFYTQKGDREDTVVTTVRSDGGANNDNNPEQSDKYKTNCATSIFYTFTGDSNTTNDKNYTVFGLVKDYSRFQELLDAIADYTETLENDTDGDGSLFTEEQTFPANQYDPIDLVRNAKIDVVYNVPVEPITIKSVKVKKY